MNEVQVLESQESQEGPIVAVQYPEKPSFVSTIKTGSELAVKYNDLMRIDIDDEVAYEKLCEAIKEVATARTDCTKEEDVIKKPLNAFRAIVISTGKSIRKNISELVEEPLKLEKKRVDDIKADRLLEQQKLWMKNLSAIRSSWGFTADDSPDKLIAKLVNIDKFNTSNFDLGDYEEEAKAEIANKKIALESEIERRKQAEKERLERVAADEKLKAEKEALEKLKLEQAIIVDESEAYAEEAERKNKALMAEIEALNAEKLKNLTENEKKLISTGCGKHSFSIGATVTHNPENDNTGESIELEEAFDRCEEVFSHGVASDTFSSDELIELIEDPFASSTEADNEPNEDDEKINEFVSNIIELISNAPEEFESNEYLQAVNRVVGSMHTSIEFLESAKIK